MIIYIAYYILEILPREVSTERKLLYTKRLGSFWEQNSSVWTKKLLVKCTIELRGIRNTAFFRHI